MAASPVEPVGDDAGPSARPATAATSAVGPVTSSSSTPLTITSGAKPASRSTRGAHGRRGGEDEPAGHPTRWSLAGGRCQVRWGRDARSCASQAATNSGCDVRQGDPPPRGVRGRPRRSPASKRNGADDQGRPATPPPRATGDEEAEARRAAGVSSMHSKSTNPGRRGDQEGEHRSVAQAAAPGASAGRPASLIGQLDAAAARPGRSGSAEMSDRGRASRAAPRARAATRSRARPGSRPPAVRPRQSRGGHAVAWCTPEAGRRAPRRPRTPSRSPCRQATPTTRERGSVTAAAWLRSAHGHDP